MFPIKATLKPPHPRPFIEKPSIERPSIPRASGLSAGLVNASILLYTFWLVLPAVQTTGGAAAGVFCVALFGVGVLLDTPYMKCRWWDFALRALCAALLPLIFWFFLGRGGGNFWGYYCQQGMFWFPLLFCTYARSRRDSRLWRFLPWLLLICMAFTTLTTLYWLVEGMLRGGRIYAYSRSLGNAEPGNEAYLKELMLRNIGGYDFIYASVLSLPLTFYGVTRLPSWKRMGLILFGLTQLCMIALSQYLYALIFAVGLVGLEITAALARALSRRFSKEPLGLWASLLWGMVPLVVILLLRVPLVSGAAALCDGIGFTSVAYSLRQLLGMLTGIDTDATSRLAYYQFALHGFARAPLLGGLLSSQALLSKHSDLLDLLSGVGLLGSGVTLGMMAFMGRGALRGLGESPARPHLALQWIGLLACALLGTVLYSRDIPLVLCAGALIMLEWKRDG